MWKRDPDANARVPGSFFGRPYGMSTPRRAASVGGPRTAYIGNVRDAYARQHKIERAKNTIENLGVRFNKATGKWVWAR